MRQFINATLVGLLLACGGDPGDLFPEPPADGGAEIGTAEQGMSTRFSPVYTHGVTTGATRVKCSVSLGGGAGQSCMLPSRGIVRYRLVGIDPNEDGGSLIDEARSWKALTRRALQLDVKGAALNNGYPWPFGSAIEEDTANTWVEVTRAPCPGDYWSNNVWDFGCLEWVGAAPTVSESLVGTYKRFQGLLRIKLDVDKIVERVRYQNMGAGHEAWDYHEALEHVINGIMPAVYGSGIYASDRYLPNSTIKTWSSRFMWDNEDGYDVNGYTAGEGCRMGYWNSMGTGDFSAAAGSCPD